jgi:hypothetical protein
MSEVTISRTRVMDEMSTLYDERRKADLEAEAGMTEEEKTADLDARLKRAFTDNGVSDKVCEVLLSTAEAEFRDQMASLVLHKRPIGVGTGMAMMFLIGVRIGRQEAAKELDEMDSRLNELQADLADQMRSE